MNIKTKEEDISISTKYKDYYSEYTEPHKYYRPNDYYKNAPFSSSSIVDPYVYPRYYYEPPWIDYRNTNNKYSQMFLGSRKKSKEELQLENKKSDSMFTSILKTLFPLLF